MSRVCKEILFACGAVALALLFIINSLSLTNSAALLPRILAACIILLALLMLHSATAENRRAKAEGREEPESAPVNTQRICVFLAIIIAYVALVQPLGYFVATPLFIIGSYFYLRALSARAAVLVALGFSVLVYVVFVKMLYLPVPMGPIADFL